MRARTRAFMGLALALIGLMSAAFLFRTQASTQQHGAPEKPKVAVAVATHDIAAGTVLTDGDVRIAQWPEDVAPTNHASVSTEVVGRAALAPIQKGEPLLQHRLSATGAGAGLPVLIGPGYRALSVRVEDVVGIAGFVQPNSRVDVLVTARSNDEARSAVLLQGVRVLATGHQITASQDSGSQNSAVITLEVTPPQAEMLTLAASEGRIQLALRNPVDNASAATNGIRMNDLIPGYHASSSSSQSSFAAAAPPRPASGPRSTGAPPSRTSTSVEVFNGGTRAVTTFQETGH